MSIQIAIRSTRKLFWNPSPHRLRWQLNANKQKTRCTNQKHFIGEQLRLQELYLIMKLIMMRAGRLSMNLLVRASARLPVTDPRSSTRSYGILLLKKLISLKIWLAIPWKMDFNWCAWAITPTGNVNIVFEIETGKSIGSLKQQWNYAIKMEFHTVPLVHIRILPSASRLKNLFEQNARKHKSTWILPG